MKKIPLTQGKFAIVDDADFADVSRFKWCYMASGHACRRSKENKIVTLEEHLFGIYHNSKTRLIFINHDPLDLRRENIKITDWAVSAVHSQKTKNQTSSKYKGVFYSEKEGWIAYLTKRNKDGKREKLLYKRCASEREAGILRNKFARKFFGKLAFQNVIKDDIINESKS